jgi:hypothetical protein
MQEIERQGQGAGGGNAGAPAAGTCTGRIVA